MAQALDYLKEKSLLLIFAYAPAGLGHLRVTDALYEGVPSGVTPILLGSQDETITAIHRFVSVHPFARSIFEWGQSGLAQDIVTAIYRWYLRHRTGLIYKQLVTILEQRLETPNEVLIVATHFGLAHQIGAIKEKLNKEKNIKVHLIVQNTDDSPQYIWYVEGADLIFVPSEQTKKKLLKYGKKAKLKPTQLVVSAYPVSPKLVKTLNSQKLQIRKDQFSTKHNAKIHVAFPVSGAAVGMKFFINLIDLLYRRSPRFLFHIISKTSFYTLPYLNELISRPYVKMHIATQDKEVVDQYEEIYQQKIIGLEITKPSEQAFKALIKPTKIGGSLLLFAEPVGRQERDNLNFLIRHHLIPNRQEQQYLWRLAKNNKSIKLAKIGKKLFIMASRWRGMVLPHHSEASAHYIWWSWQQGIFAQMLHCLVEPHKDDIYQQELSSNGVEESWLAVKEYLQSGKI